MNAKTLFIANLIADSELTDSEIGELRWIFNDLIKTSTEKANTTIKTLEANRQELERLADTGQEKIDALMADHLRPTAMFSPSLSKSRMVSTLADANIF